MKQKEFTWDFNELRRRDFNDVFCVFLLLECGVNFSEVVKLKKVEEI